MALALSLFFMGLSDTNDLSFTSNLPAYLKDGSHSIAKCRMFCLWCDVAIPRLPWRYTMTMLPTHSWKSIVLCHKTIHIAQPLLASA